MWLYDRRAINADIESIRPATFIKNIYHLIGNHLFRQIYFDFIDLLNW